MKKMLSILLALLLALGALTGPALGEEFPAGQAEELPAGPEAPEPDPSGDETESEDPPQDFPEAPSLTGPAQVLSVSASPTRAAEGQSVTFTVETTADAAYLRMYAENGKAVKTWAAADFSAVEGGTRTWVVNYAIAASGLRRLPFRASADGKTFAPGKAAYVRVMPDVFSASAAPTSALKGEQIAFTVQTSASAAYLRMYAENGKAVKTWSAEGNSTLSGKTRVWTVNYAVSGAGSRALTFKASKDGQYFGPGKAVELDISSGASSDVVSVSASPSPAVKGQPVTFTVVTGPDAAYLRMYAENGAAVKTWAAASCSELSGGQRVWKVTYAIARAGNRVLTFKASPKTVKYGPGKKLTLVVQEGAEVLSAGADPSTAARGQYVTFTVTTSEEAKYLRMCAENGSSVKTWKASEWSSVRGSARVWEVPYAFKDAGNRTLTFKASADGKNFSAGAKVKVTVTKTAPRTVTAVLAPGVAVPGTQVVCSAQVKSGGNNGSWQWQQSPDGRHWSAASHPGCATATMTFTATAESAGMFYRAAFSAEGGTWVSNSVRVDFYPGPLAIRSAEVKGNSVSLAWDEVPGAAYQVLMSEEGGPFTPVEEGLTTPGCTVTGLELNTEYSFKAAVVSGGASLESAAVSVTTGDYSEGTVYRALLVAEVNFTWETCNRNAGDVKLMRNMLLSVHGAGGGDFQVTCRQDLTNQGIADAIGEAFAGADADDVSLFFIATHGDTLNSGAEAGALTTLDAEGYSDSLMMEELAAWLSAVPGKVIVILGSCGSGAAIYDPSVPENDRLSALAESFARSAVSAFSEADSEVSVPVQSFRFDEDGAVILTETAKNTGEFRKSKFYVLAAARYQQESWGQEGFNPYNYFTYDLTGGVGTEGYMPADADASGGVTLRELFAHIKKVGDVRTFYDSLSNKRVHQNVQVYPQDSGFVLFVR